MPTVFRLIREVLVTIRAYTQSDVLGGLQRYHDQVARLDRRAQAHIWPTPFAIRPGGSPAWRSWPMAASCSRFATAVRSGKSSNPPPARPFASAHSSRSPRAPALIIHAFTLRP